MRIGDGVNRRATAEQRTRGRRGHSGSRHGDRRGSRIRTATWRGSDSPDKQFHESTCCNQSCMVRATSQRGYGKVYGKPTGMPGMSPNRQQCGEGTRAVRRASCGRPFSRIEMTDQIKSKSANPQAHDGRAVLAVRPGRHGGALQSGFHIGRSGCRVRRQI